MIRMTLIAGRNTGALEDITTTMTMTSRLSGPRMTKQLKGQGRAPQMMVNAQAIAVVKTRTKIETMNGAKTNTERKKRTTARDRIIALPTVTEEIMSTPPDATIERESVKRIAVVVGKKRTARIDTETEIANEVATVTGTATGTGIESIAADTAAAVGSTPLMVLPPQVAAIRDLIRLRARVDSTSKEALAAQGPPQRRRKMRIL
jgi:hypothetical protein